MLDITKRIKKDKLTYMCLVKLLESMRLRVGMAHLATHPSGAQTKTPLIVTNPEVWHPSEWIRLFDEELIFLLI